jgi:hypothetical protein
MNTPNDPTQTVQDADVVSDTAPADADINTAIDKPNDPADQTAAPVNDTSVITDLESLIKSHITGIDNRKNELKKLREMVNDALLNDKTYQEQDKTAKEAAKIKNATKSQILKAPTNQSIVAKTHEMAAEVKEMDEALSEYLREYQRISGSNEIETDNGDVREIIYIAKLIRKANRGK